MSFKDFEKSIEEDIESAESKALNEALELKALAIAEAEEVLTKLKVEYEEIAKKIESL